MALGLTLEKGSIVMLRGNPEATGFEGISGGVGLPTLSGEISVTNLYYSGPINSLSIDALTGVYYEVSVGIDIGISVGRHVSYSPPNSGNNYSFTIGIGAEIGGGNFWDGVRNGLISATLNHAAHALLPDNGYDKNGKQINDKGGDVTDYLYDEEGNIIGSTSVEFIGAISQGEFLELGGVRGYGFRGFKMATGAIAEDNTIFEFYAGGKTLSLLGKGFNTITGGLKQWIRPFGKSYSIKGGFNTYATRWGAGGNYWKKIGSPTFQNWNRSFRQTKLPGNSWRVQDPGHFHWLKRK